MAFSVLYRPLAGPTPKRDLKTASGIKFCTLEVILHAQEVAFGHSGCPLTCKSQFLMIEFFYSYYQNCPLVLLSEGKYKRNALARSPRPRGAQNGNHNIVEQGPRQGHAELLRNSIICLWDNPLTPSVDVIYACPCSCNKILLINSNRLKSDF